MVIARGLVIGSEASEELMVDEVSTEADLANHPDMLWYADFTDFDSVWNEFNMATGNEAFQGDVYGPADGGSPSSTGTGPRFYFIEAPEMSGTPTPRAVRWATMSQTPPTAFQPSNDGSTVMNWQKFINSNTLTRWKNAGWAHNNSSGTGVGSISETDLYARFCFYFEDTYWTGINQEGVKLSGLERWSESVGGSEDSEVTGYFGGPLWHSNTSYPLHPSPSAKFYANTYWFGLRPFPVSPPEYSQETYEKVYNGGATGDGGQVLSLANNGFEILPRTWHTFEYHLKVNSFDNAQSPPVANADAAIEAWFDDQLMWSDTDFVASRVPPFASGTTREFNEISKFHVQLFHGGGNIPVTPMHFRVAGFCLARRRIGRAKLV